MTTFLLRCLAPLLLVVPGFCATVALAADDFLAAKQAFRFEARSVDAKHIEVEFKVADGYYMYRERFAFAADRAEVKLGTPAFPPGQVKYDEAFGKELETHSGRVVIRLPVESAPATFTLRVTSQGCAEAGLCYPPMQSTARLSMADAVSDYGNSPHGRAKANSVQIRGAGGG